MNNERGFIVLPLLFVVLIILIIFVLFKQGYLNLHTVTPDRNSDSTPVNDYDRYSSGHDDQSGGSGGSTGCNDFKKPPYKTIEEWKSDTSDEAKKFFEPETQKYLEEELVPYLIGYGGATYTRIEKRMTTYKGYDNDCQVHSYHYWIGYSATELDVSSPAYSTNKDSYDIYLRFDPRSGTFDKPKVNLETYRGHSARRLIPADVYNNTISNIKSNDLHKEIEASNSNIDDVYWEPNDEATFDDDTIIVSFKSPVLGSSKPCEGFYYIYTFEVNNFTNNIIQANKSKENVICLR